MRAHEDTGHRAKQGERHAVVIGGGIAGLAAAHRMLDQDPRDATTRAWQSVTVLEASTRLGGKLLTGDIAGVRVDLGAESLLARRPEAVALARAAGLGPRLREPATAGASLWTRGSLRPMPKGHVMGVPADAHSLAGVLSEEGLRRIERDRELPPTEVGDDIAVGEYVARRLGREVVDQLVEPLLGGVYAGDAYRISMRAAVPQLFRVARSGAPLTEGVRELQRAAAEHPVTGPVFMGIDGGIGQLPPAVADAVRARGGDIRTGTRATALHRTREGRWSIRTEGGPGGPEVLPADAVIVALPAPAAARLLADEAPAAAAELGTVEYASMALITLAYRSRDAVLPPGTGFLVPPVDGHTIKAATFSGSKWGWVAEQDPGVVVLRASVGRYGESDILRRDDDALVEVARHDLRAATGLEAGPVASLVTRWDDGLPQYPVGHHARVERVRAALPPGVAVCGAAYDGVGVPACVAGAVAAADRLRGDASTAARLAADPVRSPHGGAGE